MGCKSQNLIQLLKTRGFMKQLPTKINGKAVYVHDFGSPGTLMRHNIKRQWWKAMVVLQSNVFPVEASPLRPGNIFSITEDGEDGNGSGKSSVRNDCRDKYLDILTLANSRLPFSIASVGEHLCHASTTDSSTTTTDEDKAFFMQHAVTTEMLLQNYTPPSGVSRVFDHWLQMRLAWWKRISRTPSKFRVLSPTDRKEETDPIHANTGQSMSIVYDFSWGPETLELVQNIGDEQLKRMQEDTGTSHMAKASSPAKTVLPHCIECKASLEAAMAAFLVDGYHERALVKSKSQTRTTPVLQLHPYLSPFHVALVITSSQSSTIFKELCHISRQLEQDLRTADMSVFNASEHVGTLNAHFKRNDQLGIPYTLILNENTLTDGVISSRDRDTEIKKPVHVSMAAEEISRNVKATLV